VEAAACGCPVVATAASPLPDLLGDGGLYVDPGSTAEIRAALERVLEDPDLRAKMSAAASTAAAGLSWDEPARRLLALIRGPKDLPPER